MSSPLEQEFLTLQEHKSSPLEQEFFNLLEHMRHSCAPEE
jgi:hypothetical protein